MESAKEAEKLIGAVPKKSGKRGRPKKSNSKESVAAALGTSVRSVERAEQQVRLAESYPWLQLEDWRQSDTFSSIAAVPITTAPFSLQWNQVVRVIPRGELVACEERLRYKLRGPMKDFGFRGEEKSWPVSTISSTTPQG